MKSRPAPPYVFHADRDTGMYTDTPGRVRVVSSGHDLHPGAYFVREGRLDAACNTFMTMVGVVVLTVGAALAWYLL